VPGVQCAQGRICADLKQCPDEQQAAMALFMAAFFVEHFQEID
jgi:hypothetical protein